MTRWRRARWVVALGALGNQCGPGPDSDTSEADTFHDPLSMPSEPTLSVDDATSAERCGSCHEQHYAEWQTSMHAYAMVDPVYRGLVGVRQDTYGGAQDPFCLQCHSAIGTRGGEIVPGFSFEDLSTPVQEGVTCDACHRVSAIERVYNSGHVIDLTGPVRGPIEDPADTLAHESAFAEHYEQSEFCGACHDVVELNGVPLERPYQEWAESPSAADGVSCQDCHMPTYTGRAAETAPERTLHRHRWVGVDVPLVDGFVSDVEREATADEVAGLLASSAHLDVEAPASVRPGGAFDLRVTVTNDLPGHNFPTGSTFLRQVWLEVVVTDGAGDVVFETGTLDPNGDLRDRWSETDPYGDANLVTFGSRLIDRQGQPVFLTWQAAEHVVGSIPPLLSRTNTYFVPADADLAGPLTVRTRLRFRTHPPFVLRLLGLDAALEQVRTYDVDVVEVVVDVEDP